MNSLQSHAVPVASGAPRLLRDTVFTLLIVLAAIACGYGLAQAWRSWTTPAVVEAFDPALLGTASSAGLVMIASDRCPACAAARTWLAARKVHYTELTLEQSAQARSVADALDVQIVPCFLFGTTRINGFAESELAAILPSGPG